MTEIILYLAHNIDSMVLLEIENLKRSLPNIPIAIIGYNRNAESTEPVLNYGVPVYSYSQSVLSDLPYFQKLGHVDWDLPVGHPDLPVMKFFRENPKYDFYWLIEYDVRYTGEWAALFDELRTSPADLLGTNILTYKELTNWGWWGAEHLPISFVPLEQRIKAFLPFARASRTLLQTINDKYEAGWSGHHEMAWATICAHSSLKLEDIGGHSQFTPASRVGRHYMSNPMHWALFPGTFVYRPGFSHQEIMKVGTRLTGSGMLWHPVKVK